LGDRFELVVLDPRGTGGSSVPADGGYRQEDYITDLEELRLHLGLQEFDLLGHSHGGFVATRSVVLSDAGHFVWFDERDRFREGVTRFLPE
jgi:pimeloyl-ACP methyl ester carboxylesterase